MIIPPFNALSSPVPTPGAQVSGADSLPGLDGGSAAKPSAFAKMLQQQRQNDVTPAPREPNAQRAASTPRREPAPSPSRDAQAAAKPSVPNAAKPPTPNAAKPVTPKKTAEASDAAKVEKKNSAAADKAAEDADNKPSPSTVDPVLAHLAASPEAATVACLAIGLPGTAAGPAPGSGATGLDDAAVLVDPTAIATGAVLAAATAATAAAAPPGAARANGMPTAASADQHRVADGAESSRAELSVDVPPGLLKQAGLAMELPSSSNMAAQRAQLSEPAERPGLTAHLATGHADHRGDLLNNLAASMDKDSRRVGSVSEVAASASAAQPLAPFAVGPGASQRLPDVAPSVVLTTPVQAPEFREALATQVSLLAKDGVQQASLQLNPADMGPISVQISLDGTQARVDFAVDSAATRHIIEAGLPELASALREAGLTLSGGGVSQQQSQSAQQEAGAQHPGRSTPSGREEADPADAPGRRTVSVATGGLDLYA